MLPTTIKDFVIARLAELPPVARLVVLFDPYADLNLGETLIVEPATVSGITRTWRVLRYDGNDLAFRKQQGSQPGQHDLIWVTAPPGTSREYGVQIKLQSMIDVWQRAEVFIDASLPGILRQLAPGETWPEAPIWEHAEILGQNLALVIEGWQTVRPRLKYPVALDKHLIRALALHCLKPDLPIEQFLFQVDTPARVLDNYLDLLWRTEWSEIGLTLLQKQAGEAPHLEQQAHIQAWLDTPPPNLARYIYLRRFLGRFNLPNIANQLRGLGLFEVETDILEAQVGRVLERWDQDHTWRHQIIRQAEASLEIDEINQVVELLGLNTPLAAAQAFAKADTPATIYALQVKLFVLAFESSEAHRYTPEWIEYRPQSLDNLPDTPYKQRALHLANLLDEISFIDSRLPLSLSKQQDIAHLLDRYIEHKLYDLEYAHARASSETLHILDVKLRRRFERYLEWQKGMISASLDELDRNLAELITTDWRRYLGHPRLATNILNDLVKKRHPRIDSQARLWVVIFDGMRWDTWANHVKPRLLETFEMVESEKPYLSLLPSWTGIARTGLLAGKLPGDWKSYKHHFTKDQAQLAAILFNLPQREYNRQLQFFSTMESGRRYHQAQSGDRYPYNILVYNISDDNLHSQQGGLAELNKVVDTLLENILQALKNLIEPEDTLIIASDHGFVELDEKDAVVVPDDRRWERYQRGEAHPVHYRYLTTHEIPDTLALVYKVEYRGLLEKYTVAIGRRWFKRAESRGREDRYTHGGLSMAEMVVPGAILKRIVTRQVKPILSWRPDKLEIYEKETQAVVVTVANEGNTPLTGQLTLQANTADEALIYPISLPPGESRQVTYNVEGYYRNKGYSTRQVTIALSYQDEQGQEKKMRKQVPVLVLQRKDIVELDFGGLSDLDI